MISNHVYRVKIADTNCSVIQLISDKSVGYTVKLRETIDHPLFTGALKLGLGFYFSAEIY